MDAPPSEVIELLRLGGGERLEVDRCGGRRRGDLGIFRCCRRRLALRLLGEEVGRQHLPRSDRVLCIGRLVRRLWRRRRRLGLDRGRRLIVPRDFRGSIPAHDVRIVPHAEQHRAQHHRHVEAVARLPPERGRGRRHVRRQLRGELERLVTDKVRHELGAFVVVVHVLVRHLRRPQRRADKLLHAALVAQRKHGLAPLGVQVGEVHLVLADVLKHQLLFGRVGAIALRLLHELDLADPQQLRIGCVGEFLHELHGRRHVLFVYVILILARTLKIFLVSHGGSGRATRTAEVLKTAILSKFRTAYWTAVPVVGRSSDTLHSLTHSLTHSPTVRASEHEPHEAGRENVADAGRLVECLRRQAERVRHSKCPLRHAGL